MDYTLKTPVTSNRCCSGVLDEAILAGEGSFDMSASLFDSLSLSEEGTLDRMDV